MTRKANWAAVSAVAAAVSALVALLAYTHPHSPSTPIPSENLAGADTPTETWTPASPAQTTMSTSAGPTYDPGILNDASTDPTPFTPAALLAQSFTDNSGLTYELQSGSVENCVGRETPYIQGVLSNAGCPQAVIGTYVDTTSQIMVYVQVMAFSNVTIAGTTADTLNSTGVDDWGIWCPPTGPGSQLCTDNAWWRVRRSRTWHYWWRYMYSSTAYWIGSGPSDDTKLGTAKTAAVDDSGPQGYVGNNYKGG